MRNPFIKINLLMEGRNLRLPLTILFYNAILAFVMLTFLVFNTETFQEGYYYDASPYIHQFLIISSIQIVTVFILMPFHVSGMYVNEREKHILDQFALVPGIKGQFVVARILQLVMTHSLLFLSGVPVVGLSCIYTGLGWQKVIRLALLVMMFAFWSGAVSVFFYSVSSRPMWSFAGGITVQFALIIGTILAIEILRTTALFFTGGAGIPEEVSGLCLFLLAVNPLSCYLGYYGNITGDNGLISFYCSHFGVDASSRIFSLLFYKISALACIFTGLLFLFLSVKYFSHSKINAIPREENTR